MSEASATTRGRRPLSTLVDPALLLILLLGLYFRWQYIHLPMAEAHRWREVTNADVARQFFERSMNLFYPQVNWGGGGNAYVGMEFPLLQWIVALFYWIWGEQAIIGRLVSIAFSLTTVAAVYVLGKRLFGAPAGRAAAFLVAISPSSVFFGRFFISDTPMVTFSVLGVLGWFVYFERPSTSAAVLASVATALACLVKIPALMIMAPIAWIAWEARRWRALVDRRFMIGATTAVLVAAAWYWHADRIFHQTGLGEAIWHPSGTYPAPISLAAGPFTTIYHWSKPEQLLDLSFWRLMIDRAWTLHLTPVGFVLAMFGWLTSWRRPHRRIVDAWLGVVLLFMYVTIEGNTNHEFHQLPLVPPAALLFGLAAAPVFDGEWLRGNVGRFWGVTGSAAALLVVALLSFDYSGVVRGFFRPGGLDMWPIRIGEAIQQKTAPDSLFVTVEYEEFGNNSPILLYWAHRRGWSFDLGAITPQVIELLRDRYGARYFVSTVWPAVARDHAVVQEYLATKRRIDLPGMPEDTVMYDLNQPAAPEAP